PALFEYVASAAPDRDLAWDCGTGNGQAAVGLAQFFKHVVATDASAEQIAPATPHERVEYLVAAAEKAAFQSNTFSAVTSATAVHWFDLDTFYALVRRVLKSGGLLGGW